MPQPPSKQAPWDLTQFSQSPPAAPLYFSESHGQPEISPISKVILVLGKARISRASDLGCKGMSHLSDLMFGQKVLQETWCMSECIVMMKLPITVAHSCGLLTHLNISCRGMFKPNAKFDVDSLLYLLGHFDWDRHTVQVHMLTQQHLRPHWLVQWSRHCSHMFIPVHSPWLPGYIDVTQTILIILTMVGLFPHRLCIYHQNFYPKW